MFLQAVILLMATWAASAIIESLLQPKANLTRVGANPGPMNLRVWWARWKWYNCGHSDVIKTYEQASRTCIVMLLIPILREAATSQRLELCRPYNHG